ncbi:hypothetical protein PAXINDRAFT_140101 [Paxillus involutus ATCC 200175]|uniref:Uncharacterized protein n=1 Tax=Paxillus involutus ATCC 200175 TaxID=664439 RepID=A0A0C9T7Z8_PAXIN|nr:hypothetical protein PAXINDRAFT_140101 [Paxillus involutus ATCC 200175]
MGKVKEKLTAPTRGTRTTAMRGKVGKQANARLTTTVKSDAVLLKETSVQISRATVATRKDHSSLDSSTLVHDMAQVYTSEAENIVLEAKLDVVQEAPKVIAVQPHKPSRASAKAKRAPWEDPNFAQHVSSGPIPPESEVKVHVKKEIPDAELLVAGFDAMSNDVIQSDDVIEYSISLKGGSEDLVEVISSGPGVNRWNTSDIKQLACDLPTKQSTPGKEVVTIDLTRDDSPVQKKPQVHTASAPPMEATPASSETGVHATMGASDKFVCTDIQDVTCELTLPPSPPRRKRLSVTFASPVEHPVPDDATPELTKTRPTGSRLAGTRSVQTQTVTDYLGSPTDTTPSGRLLSVSEDYALSPLGVPMMFANGTLGQTISSWVTPQQSKVYLSNKGTRIADVKTPISVAHEPIADEVQIQDIVDVLNDIQDVIIEGVSKRFKNVKNHVRAVRDRLMQQALDDLQDMAIEKSVPPTVPRYLSPSIIFLTVRNISMNW